MADKLAFELYKADSQDNKPFAKIWWTGRKVECDSAFLRRQLENVDLNGTSIKDGLDFFNNIPLMFTNGYITVKRAK